MENSLAKVVSKRISENGKQQLIVELDDSISDRSLKRFSRDGEVVVNVELFDNRYLSAQQNKTIHGLIREIHNQYDGGKGAYSYAQTKELIKQSYRNTTGIGEFSLKKCSMSFAKDFISFLLLLIHELGMHTTRPGREITEDISYYVYLCLVKRKCVICDRVGSGNQVHHYDSIGMGLDRNQFDHTKSRMMCLCWVHHTETHFIGLDTFFNKYHVAGIKVTQQDLDTNIKYPYEVKNRQYGPEQLATQNVPEIFTTG
ncbi:putative HNHc nuclease [Carnobacterium maltaromaticum]|uniref:putative HNHc nuclease n=1 Tax=Carnobacterium maltaromaticum TaxID=2751 RepID=UPI0006917802|nr:putative HNHc nuclease [Carnobacterium maltaromaticum]KRN62731.1 hypothetical protein IV70_GL003437 [Carnobacterium maltaromaticum DSM 20342]